VWKVVDDFVGFQQAVVDPLGMRVDEDVAVAAVRTSYEPAVSVLQKRFGS
jgi:hypothetical protein